ncbi:MAG: PH domain-containing protein [Actinomycetia bacterium]|nr:PH domain-containing protein [Actinomycetes bacterium]
MRGPDDMPECEPLVMASRPAASLLVWPAFWLVGLAAAVGVALGWMPPAWRPAGPAVVAAAAAVVAVLLVVRPLVAWLTRRCWLTPRRLRITVGVVRRVTHDVLLGHVQEVAHSRSWWQKVRGAGTLLLTTTAGTTIRVADLPQIERWHALVAELAWAQRDTRPASPGGSAEPTTPLAGDETLRSAT